MKKVLVAAAVASAFAGAASAQNVTMYGLLDATYAQIKTGSTSVTAQGQGDYLGSSSFGFRGEEDLGGGLKASFQLEGDLNMGNGTGDGGENTVTTSTTNTVGGLTFDRQAWVGIKNNDVSFRMGRLSDFGDATYGSFGQMINLFDVDTSLGSKNSNTTEITLKAMGVELVGTYSNDTGAVAAGTGQATSQSTMGVAGTVAGVKYRAGYIEQGAKSETLLGLQTTVGAATVGFLINKIDNATFKTGNTQLTVAYPLGNGVTGYANATNYSNDTTATSKFSFYGVMLTKDLSKRTTVFAGYSSKDVNNGTTTDQTISTLGLQHKF